MPTAVKLIATQLSDLAAVAQQLLEVAGEVRVWAFEGEMGAGKTTLIKEICGALGVIDHVSSPTFAIINEYATGAGKPVYHFDCYRLADLSEAVALGCEEYFDSGDYCLVEWPSRIEPLLPLPLFLVRIVADEQGTRRVEAEITQ